MNHMGYIKRKLKIDRKKEKMLYLSLILKGGINMKRKYFAIFICACSILFVNIIAYAATSYTFTYKFRHEVTIVGKKKATGSRAEFCCTTTSNKSSDTYFTIKQYRHTYIGTNPYLDSDTINIKIPSGKKLITSYACFTTKKGTSYTYEFWKPTAKGYVVGSGELMY